MQLKVYFYMKETLSLDRSRSLPSKKKCRSNTNGNDIPPDRQHSSKKTHILADIQPSLQRLMLEYPKKLARIMRIVQHSWSNAVAGSDDTPPQLDESIQLVLAFGSRVSIAMPSVYEMMRAAYPKADIMLCTTAGEIMGTTVSDDSISLTAIAFEKTSVRGAQVRLSTEVDHHEAGIRLAQTLDTPGLAMVMVLSDGQNVNGSELVAAFNHVLEGRVPVVGGLAGDGAKFESTLVGLNGIPEPGMIIAVGLYGTDLEVRCGSQGGWEAFGPERIVTEAVGNVLYKMDGQSALSLYKSYLGDRAAELPGAALLFPLSFRLQENGPLSVRTILSINEEDNSMTFAGNVPVGASARLMRASFDRLIDGAQEAAVECTTHSENPHQLAILVSCVGRKLILNQRVEEEVEEVAHVLGGAAICGFYSYGELSPSSQNGRCELLNQTMTVTTISER